MNTKQNNIKKTTLRGITIKLIKAKTNKKIKKNPKSSQRNKTTFRGVTI